MTAKQFFILVTGPAGSGKDEQVKRVVNRFGGEENVNLLHTSKLFDALKYTDERLYQLVMEYRSRGKLVPDRITIPVVQQFFHVLDRNRLVTIANGFPRGEVQGGFLIQQLHRINLNPSDPHDCCIINLQVSPEECANRMFFRKENRIDDNLDAIQERRRVESDRIEAIELFRHLSGQQVHDVDGEQTIAEVAADIEKIIARLIRKHEMVK